MAHEHFLGEVEIVSTKGSANGSSEVSASPLDERVAELIDSNEPEQIEQFWETVENNLSADRVRLLFVADQTTSELRRLVEFLNEKMADVEVLIVEVKQFNGESQTAVVPRVIGATEAARATKIPRPRPDPWTVEEFLEKIKRGALP